MEVAIMIGIVLGVIFIAISFMVKEKHDIAESEKEKLALEIRDKVLSKDTLEAIVSQAREKMLQELDGDLEEKMMGISDNMNEKANEKMMAMTEMSESLLEKIEQNHKEVVFLYDMLNQKNDDMKDFTAQIEGMKKNLLEEEKKLVLTYEYIKKKLKTFATKTSEKTVSGEKRSREIMRDAQEERSEEHRKETKELSVNERIFKLHREGKTVVEISKELGMGQGEVKLILEVNANLR